MNLKEIQQAIEEGHTVCWSNDGYTIVKGDTGNYYIKHHGGNIIGLTWLDGVTLNGKECDFYIKEA